MERSLCILLPVENRESTLAAMVMELLEIASELAPFVELVIVDDASIDATVEVADDLANRFPQIRVVGRSRRSGRAAAIGLGIQRSVSETLLLMDDDCPAALNRIPLLWKEAQRHEIVLGRPLAMPAGEDEGASLGGFQMISRRRVLELGNALDHQTALRALLEQRGIEWREVDLASPSGAASSQQVPSSESLDAAQENSPIDVAGDWSTGPRRPNFLGSPRDIRAWDR